jgi:hypothetical protein
MDISIPGYGGRRGFRLDGTPKGDGYFGPLAGPDNTSVTELSTSVELDGTEYLIPPVVPTLTRDQLTGLVAGNEPDRDLVERAWSHARGRTALGRSVWAEPGEVYSLPVPFEPPDGALDDAGYLAAWDEAYRRSDPLFGPVPGLGGSDAR